MTKSMIGSSPAKTLGLQIDLLTKWRSGVFTDRHIELFLKGQNPFRKHASNFPLLGAITLGREDTSQLLQALGHVNCKVSDYSKHVMSKPSFIAAGSLKEFEVVAPSGEELGFSYSYTFKELCQRATTEYGLQLCPAEVGPQLRKQYLNQPKYEELLIAMEPITCSVGELNVFKVWHNVYGELWLDVCIDSPETQWDPIHRWVFINPLK